MPKHYGGARNVKGERRPSVIKAEKLKAKRKKQLHAMGSSPESTAHKVREMGRRTHSALTPSRQKNPPQYGPRDQY